MNFQKTHPWLFSTQQKIIPFEDNGVIVIQFSTRPEQRHLWLLAVLGLVVSQLTAGS